MADDARYGRGGRIDDTRTIDVDSEEAFLTRADGDAGDVLNVDTTNLNVELGPGVDLVLMATAKLYLDGKSDTYISEASADTVSLIVGGQECIRLVEASNIGACHFPEITTPTAITDFGAIYPKSDNSLYFQDGDGNEHKVSLGADHYASMNEHGNSTPLDIGEAATPIGVGGMSGVNVVGFTFDAGSTGPIASFTNAAGGNVTVGDVAHGLADGDIISITGTTNYNGVFVVQNKADDTFEITHTDDGDDGTGDWYQASALIVSALGEGVYMLIYSINAESGGANKEFEWHIYINENEQEVTHANQFFAGSAREQSVGGNGVLTLAVGDRVGLFVAGVTDGTDITHKSVTVSLHKVAG